MLHPVYAINSPVSETDRSKEVSAASMVSGLR